MKTVNSSEVLTPKQTEILRTAILMAKHIANKNVAVLKRSLLHIWPGQETDVDSAIMFWSAYETKSTLDKVQPPPTKRRKGGPL